MLTDAIPRVTREEVSQKGQAINPDDDVDPRKMIKTSAVQDELLHGSMN